MPLTNDEVAEMFAKAIAQMPSDITDEHISQFIAALVWSFARSENEAAEWLIHSSWLLKQLFDERGVCTPPPTH